MGKERNEKGRNEMEWNEMEGLETKGMERKGKKDDRGRTCSPTGTTGDRVRIYFMKESMRKKIIACRTCRIMVSMSDS